MPVFFFIVWLLKVAQRYITFCTFITNHLIWSGRACGRVMIYLRCWSWSWSNISYQNITDLFVYVCFRCVFVTLQKINLQIFWSSLHEISGHRSGLYITNFELRRTSQGYDRANYFYCVIINSIYWSHSMNLRKLFCYSFNLEVVI